MAIKLSDSDRKNYDEIKNKLVEYLKTKGYEEKYFHYVEREIFNFGDVSAKYGPDYDCDLIVKNSEGKPLELYVFNIQIDKDRKIEEYENYKKQTGLTKIPAFFVSVKENELSFENFPKSTITTVSTFIKSIKDIAILENEKFFYRGQSSTKYSLFPSIYRPISKDSKSKYVDKESKLYRQAIISCPEDFTDDMSAFEKLVKMQHYSLPTRLLDISMNPLVALYFACSSNKDIDGEVFIYKVPKNDIYYFDSDSVCIISNISKQSESFKIPALPCNTEAEITSFNNESEIQYLLHDILCERSHFLPIIRKETLESVICVYPKLDNERIRVQEGAFFLYGIKGTKNTCAVNKYIPERLIIQKKYKSSILKDLKDFGIDDAHLFPTIDNKLKNVKDNFSEF